MTTLSLRKPLIAGNWKMNLGFHEAMQLAMEVSELAQEVPQIQLGIYPSMHDVGEIARTVPIQSNFYVGAQNCHYKASGAYTGEVSPVQLAASHIKHVLLGHSERRQHGGEDDELIARKLCAALEAGLRVVLCVGETLVERDTNRHQHVVGEQLACLAELDARQRERLTIAYEPLWAIGTGRTASPEQAQDMHAFIRSQLKQHEGTRVMRIIYGGSVKPDNAAGLFKQPDIDGFLVGGASLKIADFSAIVRNALEAVAS